jgi:aspartyl-tRNA(Asn)/glutamyl-tRNA(Gln) amidotransferase subunit B
MYRTIIGLEVHVQLLTKSKLFCGCPNKFGLPPNTATCPVCTGMPGVLPVMNRQAVHLAIKAGLALNCQIARFTKWDRKNYFYPDLPKNFQTSQYDLPLCQDGWLDIDGPKKIRILRAHLEEDAGKMLHDEAGSGGDSLVDLNRTGTPLLEIVSQPDLETPEDAKAYLDAIRLILREIEVSDCEMQEGSLRCDANINLHVPQVDGTFVATPIVEIKNLNSIRNVEKSLRYEAARQFEEYQEKLGKTWTIDASAQKRFRDYTVAPLLQKGTDGKLRPASKATAGWDDRFERTNLQRRKEEASDYRYFPEPDLVPVVVDDALLQRVRDEVGELPAAQQARLLAQYGLSEYDAGVLTRQGRATVRYFEAVAQQCGDAKEACNWTANDVLQMLHERKLDIHASPISAQSLGELIAEVKATKMNRQRAREVFHEMAVSGISARQAIDKLGFKPVADEGQLRDIIRRAIAGNAKAVADYKKGKTKAADAIKGAVMRETKGQANMEQVQKLLAEELENV